MGLLDELNELIEDGKELLEADADRRRKEIEEGKSVKVVNSDFVPQCLNDDVFTRTPKGAF